MIILGHADGRPDLLLPLTEEKGFVIVLGGIGNTREACDILFDGMAREDKVVVGPQDYLGYVNAAQSCGDHDYFPDKKLLAIRGGVPSSRMRCIDCRYAHELEPKVFQHIIDHIAGNHPRVIVSIESPRAVALKMFGRENRSVTGHGLQAVLEKAPPEFWVFSSKGLPSKTMSINGTLFVSLGARERLEL